MSESSLCLARFSRAKSMDEWRVVLASALMVLFKYTPIILSFYQGG